MRAIDKMVIWLEDELKKAHEYCDQNIGAFVPHPFKLCLSEARRLAAEEKSGDEAPTPKEAPEGLVEGKCSRCDGTGIATFSDGLGHYEGNCPECCGGGSIMSRPTPSRTEKPEIVCPACDFEGEPVKVCPSCGTPEKGKASFAGIAPSRTGELVKRLKALMDHAVPTIHENDYSHGWWVGCENTETKVREILRDFEGGA